VRDAELRGRDARTEGGGTGVELRLLRWIKNKREWWKASLLRVER
jgi:hypothetical protein